MGYTTVRRNVDPKVFDEVPARPVSREQLLEALDGGGHGLIVTDGIPDNQPAVLDILKGPLVNLLRVGQWFDFGRLDVDTATRAGLDARPFADAKLLILPYPNTIFRVRLVSSPESLRQTIREAGSTQEAWFEERGLLKHEIEQEMIFAACETDKGEIMIVSMTVNGTKGEWVRADDILTLNGDVLMTPSGTSRHAAGREAVFNALWLMLNTKHINTEIDVADEKLNRVRVKAGKRPLQPVTRIDAGQYITALRETERREVPEQRTVMDAGSSSRLSPRMHLRRAHLRHLSDSKVIPIHAMIINGRKEMIAPVRDKYVVDKPLDGSSRRA